MNDMNNMSDQQFFNRLAEVLNQEQSTPEQWFYLSFADDKFLGAVIIRARGIVEALLNMKVKGISNPGGEVMGCAMPEEVVPAEKYRNRLLTLAEITEFWPEAKTLREWEQENPEEWGDL